MHQKIILLSIYLIFSGSAFAQKSTITLQVDEAPLREVISMLENDYGYLFSYKEADIENIRVTIRADDLDIRVFLGQILKKTGLTYEWIESNYIILRKTTMPGSGPEETSSPTLLCGTVMDSLLGTPLSYASIYFKRSGEGNYADEDGSFSFRPRFSEGDTLVISYAGYEEKYFPARHFTREPCQVISLQSMTFGEDFIIVTDYLTDGIDLGDNGASTVLRPDRIGVLPGQAEPDVFSTIQFLPGINAPNGEAANMYIRGGAADQNLILWEDIPIYHAAHYFGMISAFNPYIIDKIKVYRGGFGPEYGGRVSGVIDMRSADYKLERSEFGAGLNFLNGYTHGKIAIPENKASIVYSLRRSLAELWRSPTFENITQRNQQGVIQGNLNPGNLPRDLAVSDQFDFLDTHVKATTRLSAKDEVAVSFFYNQNDFDNQLNDVKKQREQIDVLDLKSHGTSLAWSHSWSPQSTTRLLGLSTLYDYDYAYQLNWLDGNTSPNRFGNKNNEVREQQLHLAHSYQTGSGQEIRLGYQFTHYDVAYQIRHASDEAVLANEQEEPASGVQALYGAFSSPKDQDFGIDAGIRMDGYAKNRTAYFSPRIRLWYNLSDVWRLQANAGKYHQFIAQLVEFRGDFFGIDTPIWVLAGEREVPVLDASQFQLGFVFSKNAWVVDVQAYTKRINGITSLATGFDPTPQNFDIGYSTSGGIDILLKKRLRNVRIWASYSLSKAIYHFDRFFDPDFAAPFDQRHAFSLSTQVTLGKFQCSLGMSMASGIPYSLMEDFKVYSGPMGKETLLPVFRGFNNSNLPLQHHLDASFLYKIEPKRASGFRGYAGLSLFNIYGQQNIYNREYYVSRPPGSAPGIEYTDWTGLGFTPNAVLRFEW